MCIFSVGVVAGRGDQQRPPVCSKLSNAHVNRRLSTCRHDAEGRECGKERSESRGRREGGIFGKRGLKGYESVFRKKYFSYNKVRYISNRNKRNF